MKSMKRYLESEGCDNETDFEAENVIGVKLVRVGKKKEKRWLYLTTFRGYGPDRFLILVPQCCTCTSHHCIFKQYNSSI